MSAQATVSEIPLPGVAATGYELVSPRGKLTATVAPHDGGAVTSLIDHEGGELLYRANEFDPPAPGQWMGRAPLLWPAVGRNFTPDVLGQPDAPCGFEWQGRVWALPIHGFARHYAWEVTDQGADGEAAWVSVGLSDNEATRAVYPWPFCVEMTHRLDDAALTTTVRIESAADRLPFCIGNHLTVVVPPETWDQATLAANVSVLHGLTPHSLMSAEVTPLDLSGGRPLSDDVLHNTVLGGLTGPPWMRLTREDGLTLTVRQAALEGGDLVRPEDWLFVLYGNRELGYFCPEPWIGRPNGLQDRTGRIELPANRRFRWQMRIEIGG